MNILYYDRFYPDHNFGGVERVTTTLAAALRYNYSYNIYCITPDKEGGGNRTNTLFNDIIYLDNDVNSNYEFVKEFIVRHKIDIIISQYAIDRYNPLFHKLRADIAVKLITCYHFNPGCEFLTLEAAENFDVSICQSFKDRVKCTIKNIFRPIYVNLTKRRIISNIKSSYYNSDRFVLLSDKFTEDFHDKFEFKGDLDKIIAIGNPLTYNEFCTIAKIHCKQNIVLIVSRLDEIQKRISYSLKIWEIIVSKYPLKWRLVIVGDGKDREQYERYVKTNNIKNVEFLGTKEPYAEYLKASIFMMTSLFEGFGMTLTEAQQLGVVPIAFDSYKSLHDIIENKKTGVIIPNKDINRYADELLSLMQNDDYRRSLAIQAVASSSRFSIDEICQQWIDLFQYVKND